MCSDTQIGIAYGNPEVTTGGLALKYYCSIRIDVRKTEVMKSPKGEQIGIRVKAKVGFLLRVEVHPTCLAEPYKQPSHVLCGLSRYDWTQS